MMASLGLNPWDVHSIGTVVAGGDGLQEVVGDKATALKEHARRTWLIAVRSKRAPGHSRGLLLVQQGCCLPAGLEAGSATRAAVRAAAKDVTGGDKLDPKRTVAFVVRGGTGPAYCIQAALLRTRRCSGESRQLEDHPRAAIQFRHAEGQGRPFGCYLVLGARSYVGCTGDWEILAVEAENDWRLRRCTGAASTASTGRTTTARSSARSTR